MLNDRVVINNENARQFGENLPPTTFDITYVMPDTNSSFSHFGDMVYDLAHTDKP